MLKNKKNNVFSIIYEVLLYVYMFFVPMYTIGANVFDNFNASKVAETIMCFSIFICIATFIIFVIEIIKGKRLDLSNIKVEFALFIIFIVWCGISTLFSSNFQDSVFGVPIRYCGLIHFISYFMFGYLGYSLSDKGRIRFLRIFVLISMIIALLSIVQHYFSINILPFNIDSTFREDRYYSNITGIFYNSNHYGYYIVYSTIISIFLFIYDKNKILKSLNFIIYVINIYVLIINDTFGCYITILISMLLLLFYFLKTKTIHNYLYLFLIIPFILLSIFLNDNGYYYERENFHQLLLDLNVIVDTPPVNEEVIEEYNPVWNVGNYRGSLWIHGIKYSLEKPIFGYGLENLKNRYLKDYIDISHPHNFLINLSATVGIPGMLFYISALISILIKCIKNIKNDNIIMNMCCFFVIAHLISSMFGVTMYYVTVYFIIVLGITLKFLVDSKKINTDKDI